MNSEEILLAARLVSNPYTPDQILVMEQAYDWYVARAGSTVPLIGPHPFAREDDSRQKAWDVAHQNYMEHAMGHSVTALRIKAELQRIGHWPTVEAVQPMTISDFSKLFADAIRADTRRST